MRREGVAGSPRRCRHHRHHRRRRNRPSAAATARSTNATSSGSCRPRIRRRRRRSGGRIMVVRYYRFIVPIASPLRHGLLLRRLFPQSSAQRSSECPQCPLSSSPRHPRHPRDSSTHLSALSVKPTTAATDPATPRNRQSDVHVRPALLAHTKLSIALLRLPGSPVCHQVVVWPARFGLSGRRE